MRQRVASRTNHCRKLSPDPLSARSTRLRQRAPASHCSLAKCAAFLVTKCPPRSPNPCRKTDVASPSALYEPQIHVGRPVDRRGFAKWPPRGQVHVGRPTWIREPIGHLGKPVSAIEHATRIHSVERAPERVPQSECPRASAPERVPQSERPRASAPERVPQSECPRASAPERVPSRLVASARQRALRRRVLDA